MFCGKCGAELKGKESFCPQCGAELITVGNITNNTDIPQETVSAKDIPYNEPQSKAANIKIGKKTVAGLIAAAVIVAVLAVGYLLISNHKTTIDISGYYTVEITGISPYGSAEVITESERFAGDYSNVIRKNISNNEDYDEILSASDIAEEILYDCVDVMLSEDEGLSNGDEISVSYDIDENLVEHEYGIKLKAKDYTISVNGLDSYVTTCDEISADNLKELQAAAEDAINAKEARSYDGSTKFEKNDYAGLCVRTLKYTDSETVNSDWFNSVILLYKNRSSGEYSYWGGEKFGVTTDYFYYIAFPKVTVSDDGSIAFDPTEYDFTNNRFSVTDEERGGRVLFTGYESFEDFHRDIIDADVDECVFDEEFDNDVIDSVDRIINGNEMTTRENIQSEDNTSDKENSEDSEDENAASESDSAVGTLVEVFPDSSDRALSESEIASLTLDETQDAINEIWARNGYIFGDKEKNDYYSQKYDLTIPAGEFDAEEILSDTEYENVQKLADHRKELE